MTTENFEAISKSKQFADFLRNKILKGNFKEGDKFPSVTELAREFGISRTTVDKVVSMLVAEGLLHRISGKGTFMQPKGRTRKNRIAVIVSHSDNPYYSKIIRGVTDTAREKGYHLILCNSEGKINKEKLDIKGIMAEADGVLLCSALDKEGGSPTAEKLLVEGFPFVLISHLISSKNIHKMHYVIADGQKGGYLATKHLIGLGRQKVAFFTHKNCLHDISFESRFSGYKEALFEAGIPFQKKLVLETTAFDAFHGYEKDGYRIADKIISMEERPTAIFANGDSLAIGLLRALREKGIRVPEDIALCGFDDIDLASQWGIELTTVAQPKYQIGKKAVKIVIEEHDGETGTPQHVVLPVELKVRRTCGAHLASKKEQRLEKVA